MNLFSNKNDDLVVTQLANYQAEILAYIHSILPGDPSANDVLQRTNLVIWKKRNSYKPDTNFRAWAFSIARWEVKAHLKENQRKSWLIVDEDLTNKLTETMLGGESESATHSMRSFLEICIKKLKPEEQEIVIQRYYSDIPFKEFAKSHKLTLGSLKVKLHRIRSGLKRCIESQASIKQLQEPHL